MLGFLSSMAAMPNASGQLDKRIQLRWPRLFSRIGLTIVCLLCVAVLGYLDYVTGYEQSLLLFYLVPITLATWFEGLAFGLLFSGLSLCAWVGSDIMAGIPQIRIWNLAMATAAYVVFTFLLHNLRTLLRDLDERVRERTRALRREMAERQRLDQEIAEIADRERLLLGQELHDGLCQHLTGTALTAQTLRQRLAARGAVEVGQADQVVRYLEAGIDMSRNLARGLFSPELESDGLMVALHGLAENMTERSGIPCTFDSDGIITVSDANVATQLHRIAQEATTNAIKHSRARQIDIRLEESETELRLAVSDDGIGLPKTRDGKGLGLRLMRHGAELIGAEFRVEGNEGGGTTVLCKVNRNQKTEL
jgi:signal transduction histidine kinase